MYLLLNKYKYYYDSVMTKLKWLCAIMPLCGLFIRNQFCVSPAFGKKLFVSTSFHNKAFV